MRSRSSLTKGGKKKNASKRFEILHVDHGLRKESEEEYRFVRSLPGCRDDELKDYLRKFGVEHLYRISRRLQLRRSYKINCQTRETQVRQQTCFCRLQGAHGVCGIIAP